MTPDRRRFLAQLARLSALSSCASAFPLAALARTTEYPFGLGVASGAPKADRILLWTRLVPVGIVEGEMPELPIRVKWEVAADEGFRRIVQKGEAMALPALGHSVHVDVTQLDADRWYWYRFSTDNATSPVGRTRTAPAEGALATRLKIAVASCQHWEFGHYAAHGHLAEGAPDLVAFLGDYVYEWGPYDLKHPRSPRRSDESFSLTDYRRRYAQYKSDGKLQAAHQAAPWIVTWDDHEVANDYANERDELLSADFMDRRAAAYQAFYENMPIRIARLPTPGRDFAHLQIHQRFDWGRLACIHVLDDRQYRSPQVCPRSGRGGSTSVTDAECPSRLDPDRTMLGAAQENWLAEGFASSRAQWNLLAQQTLMAQSSQTAMEKPGDGRFWTDGWDGYPVARERLLADIARHRPSNPVVLSGDVHTFYVTEIRRDFNRAVSSTNPVLATEFCSTSITSNSRPQTRTDQYVAQNSHVKYGRSDKRGFTWLEITPDTLHAKLIGLDDVQNPASGTQVLASFEVRAGQAGVERKL